MVSNFFPFTPQEVLVRETSLRDVSEERKICWCITAMWEKLTYVIVIFIKLQILYKLQLLACIFLSSDKEIRDLARITELSSMFKIQCVISWCMKSEIFQTIFIENQQLFLTLHFLIQPCECKYY